MILSNLPGLVRAESSAAGRFVAAMTTTPVLSSNPSISVSSWFIVCTDSACTPRQTAYVLVTGHMHTVIVYISSESFIPV